jgi:hypothetical protein
MEESAQLEEKQRRALDRLKPVSDRLGLYLAGGRAIAFHLGHRVSPDLALFSRAPDLDLGALRRSVVALPEVQVISLSDAMFRFRIDTVSVDVVRYGYPLLNATAEGPEGFSTASLEDLATMKLAAIARRGSRRDFWDLSEILRQGRLSLEGALECYVRRFGVEESDVYQVLRALTYFEDAEREETEHHGLTDEIWATIKTDLTAHAKRVLLASIDGGEGP